MKASGKGILFAAAMILGFIIASAITYAAERSGKELFAEHCVLCHADGGNIVNPQKTLMPSDLKKNGIQKASDIVKLMREPGSGMTVFDKQTVSDRDANKIAEYILRGKFK